MKGRGETLEVAEQRGGSPCLRKRSMSVWLAKGEAACRGRVNHPSLHWDAGKIHKGRAWLQLHPAWHKLEHADHAFCISRTFHSLCALKLKLLWFYLPKSSLLLPSCAFQSQLLAHINANLLAENYKSRPRQLNFPHNAFCSQGKQISHKHLQARRKPCLQL